MTSFTVSDTAKLHADLEKVRKELLPTGYRLFQTSELPVWHVYNPPEPMPRQVFVLRFDGQWEFEPVNTQRDRAFEELRLIVLHTLSTRGSQ